jgi:hypothetical protein
MLLSWIEGQQQAMLNFLSSSERDERCIQGHCWHGTRTSVRAGEFDEHLIARTTTVNIARRKVMFLLRNLTEVRG